MDRKKLLPLILALFLLVVLAILLYSKVINKYSYNKIIAIYNNQKQEQSDLNGELVLVINNVSFWIDSKNKDTLILKSSEKLNDDNDNSTDRFLISTVLDTKVCFKDESCVLFKLV